jgi:hypothetical protein
MKLLGLAGVLHPDRAADNKLGVLRIVSVYIKHAKMPPRHSIGSVDFVTSMVDAA